MINFTIKNHKVSQKDKLVNFTKISYNTPMDFLIELLSIKNLKEIGVGIPKTNFETQNVASN